MGAALRFTRLVGVGGVGTGLLFALEGNHDLGRNESRLARLQDVRDYCKLHIIAHYPAVLLGAAPTGSPFHVLPVGKIGDDEPGQRVRREMAAVGMDLRFVDTVADRPTLQSICFQYPDGSGGNLTTSESAAAALRPADVDRAASLIDEGTIALAAPEVPLEARHHLLRIGTRGKAFRAAALTSAEASEARSRGLLADADLVALNEDEAAALTGVVFDPRDPQPLLGACASSLTKAQPSIHIVVSAGRHGAFGFAGGRWSHVPALDVPIASTAGAGDALLGGLLAALAMGAPFVGEDARSLSDRPLASALDFGVLLSAFKVTSPHSIHPGTGWETLRAFAEEHGVRFAEPVGSFFPSAHS